MAFVTEALKTSKGLRVPVFEHGVSPRVKIEQLESYLLLSAFQQGELAEERLDALVTFEDLRREWDHLEGWEPYKRTRTEAGVEDAKRQLRPDLYDQRRDLEWTIKRLSEEIERLERDATKVSRAYSMTTGT
jgi:hypothetical protein